MPHMGIAALPRLHVAAHFFLFLWTRWVDSRLRNLFLVVAVLTFTGSIATGWHYQVDGLAGLVLAAFAFALAVVIHRTLARTRFMSGEIPAPP